MLFNHRMFTLTQNLITAPLDDTRWQSFASYLADYYKGSAVIGINYNGYVNFNTVAIGNVDIETVKTYNLRTKEYTSLVQEWLKYAKSGDLTRKADDLSDHDFEKSDTYIHFMKDWGWYWGLVAKIERGRIFSVDAVIAREKEQEICSEYEYNFFKLLMPHIRAAVRVRRLLDLCENKNEYVSNSYTKFFGPAIIGFLIVDRYGNIVVANTEAIRILSVYSAVGVKQGSLYCNNPTDQDKLKALIKQAIELSRGQSAVVPSLGGLRMNIQLNNGDDLAIRGWPISPLQDEFGDIVNDPCAMLFIGDSEKMRQSGAF